MDVITLGETMVLFTPDSTGLMRYAGNFSAKVAGAESNVAIGLARLGHQSGWMSRLGEDELGKKVLSFIRGENVDVSRVSFDPSASTGLYLKEKLAANEMKVHYYRKDSAASGMQSDDLDEAYIAKFKYLHVTGITPALSQSCYETIVEAIAIAKKNNITVVFDPNLRKKLWTEIEARRILLELSAMSDIVLPGIEEGEFLFGETHPEKLAASFHNLGAKCVILKLGKDGAYYSSETDKGYVEGYQVDQVIDTVGAGDGFAAGFISGLLDHLTLKQATERANAVGALVTMVDGDVEGLPERSRLLDFMNATNREDVSR
ncbi:sugar kinase [Pseudalkalibacillus hwajinpoensis]|uniref:sugar kinase n=1 Tax=Guptibacillus hwajinpoensis TaxID=208199 RepID=UPI00325B0E09